jgi:hypothetical protein
MARFSGMKFESYLKDAISCVLGLLRDLRFPEMEGIYLDILSAIESMAIATGPIFLEHVDFDLVAAGVVNAMALNKHNISIKLAIYQFARNTSNSLLVLDTIEDFTLLVPVLEKSCRLVESLSDTHSTFSEIFNMLPL